MKLRNALLYALSSVMPCRLIKVNGQPYMERYFVVKAFGRTVYLHRYLDSDGDRHLHDHPWRSAYGIPLCGGYSEDVLKAGFIDDSPELLVERRDIGTLKLNRIKPYGYHRIARVRPNTWTLFVHSERVKRWGFLEISEKGMQWVKAPDSKTNWHRNVPRGRDADRQPLSHFSDSAGHA